jgi:hypothetical protein
LGGGKYINVPENFLQNDSGVEIRLKWAILAKNENASNDIIINFGMFEEFLFLG